jgi:hypothetical protein
MEKLTLNHLLAYAPYGVMVTKDNWDNILRVVVDRYELDIYDININVALELEAKLILKPLSELNVNPKIILEYPYKDVQDLLSKHYDVFGLIPKGLAYDINTLENGTEEDSSEQGEHNQAPDRKGTGNGWEIHDRHPRR